MQLESSTVSRTDLITAPLNKEWWYTGCVNDSGTVYVSVHVLRMPLVDNIAFTVFDVDAGVPLTLSRKLRVNASSQRGRTDLKGSRPGFSFRHAGRGEDGWSLQLQGDEVSATLETRPTAPPFTKVENQFRHTYSLLSFMQNRVDLDVRVTGRNYSFDGALGYWDHCSGTVPRRTGWHWLAVQNEDVAVVSLLNYGPYGQKYSQVLRCSPDGTREWVRLSQDVCFEYSAEDKQPTWRLTGRDVDLEVEVLMGSRIRERIPPVLPLLVDLTHEEYFVRATGRVRVDHGWTRLAPAYGVLEEHHGRW